MIKKVIVSSILSVSFLAASILVLQLSGCGGGGGGFFLPAATTGTLQVGITDAPSTTFTHVFINISSVKVAPQGSENKPDNDPGLPTIITFPGGREIDIMTLGVGGSTLQQILGSAVIPAGTYTQIRLILKSKGNGVVTASCGTVANPTPLQLPSEEITGIKMPVKGRFYVTAGVLNAILIDFDPNTAIVKEGNDCSFLLKPTGIRITQISTSLQNAGSISGLIHTPIVNFNSWSSAKVSVRQNTNVITTGVVFSNFSSPNVWKGPFTAFVPDGSNYKVFVVAFRDSNVQIPAAFQVYSSQLINVTQGLDSPVPPDGVAYLKAQ